MYQVSVRWNPVHELISSLGHYLDRKSVKTSDLGIAWTNKVRKQLRSEFQAILDGKVDVEGANLHVLAEQYPGVPDIPSFLTWLAEMPTSEFYERVSPVRLEHFPPLPTDLAAHRDFIVRLLSGWHDQYFSHLDQKVLEELAAEANSRSELVRTQSPQDAVEDATNGIVLDPACSFSQIILIPGYHQRPANFFLPFKGFGFYVYGYENPTPSQTPPRLLRMLRALPDDSRIRILRFISREPRAFMEIVGHTGLALSTVHHHMVTLRASGLVRVHETNPGIPNAPIARYSFRPSALEGLGERLIALLQEGESL